MKNQVYKAINKTLAFLLMLSILGVGGYAIHLTHVHATVIVNFGDESLVDSTKLAADLTERQRMEQFNSTKKVVIK